MDTLEAEKKTERGHRKELTGVVVSDRQDKTLIVEVTRWQAHPRYKKVINIKKRYAVHDQENTARVGDKVVIAETKPLSKRKCWRLKEIMSHAE